MKKSESSPLYHPATGSQLLTTAEAAAYLNYHVVSVSRLVQKGVLKPFCSAGKTLLFQRNDLDRFRLTSRWAARKTGVETASVPAPGRAGGLRAQVKVDFGTAPFYEHPVRTIDDFTWEMIPRIRADVDNKYGARCFRIEVESPDGSTWSVEHAPPAWLPRFLKGLFKKAPK